MDGYARYWGNGAKILLVLAAAMLLVSILSTQATTWVSFQQGGKQVNQDFSAVAGALGQPWVYFVPMSGLAILLGLYFVSDIEGRQGMAWRKKILPTIIALVILSVAMVVIIMVAAMLDKEMMRRDLSFWNNAGGGWYLALSGAALGIFAIVFGALVTKGKKRAAGADAAFRTTPQGNVPPPPPFESQSYGSGGQQSAQGNWPEFPVYGQGASASQPSMEPAAAPPPPPSQYDSGYAQPAPNFKQGGSSAGAAKPKKKWFGK